MLSNLKPLGAAGLALLRGIVNARSFAKVNGVPVDLYSASAIVKVYDALNDANKARLIALPVDRAAACSFKLLKVAA